VANQYARRKASVPSITVLTTWAPTVFTSQPAPLVGDGGEHELAVNSRRYFSPRLPPWS
jgi:hypothetical protein